MRDETSQRMPLSNDLLATVFKHVLSENRPQNWRSLSLVCRNFHNLLEKRQELVPCLTFKSHWLALVRRLLPLDSSDQKAYFAECALGVQISSAGPVGFKAKFKGARRDILKTFNYLECQFLQLVELATLDGYKPWHGILLTEARQLLLQTNDALPKFTNLLQIAYNKNIQRVDQQSDEYFTYLNAELILGTYQNLPIVKVISSEPRSRQNSLYTILKAKWC